MIPRTIKMEHVKMSAAERLYSRQPNDFLFHLLFQSSVSIFKFVNFITDKSLFPLESRFGDEERRAERCEREKIRDGWIPGTSLEL